MYYDPTGGEPNFTNTNLMVWGGARHAPDDCLYNMCTNIYNI